MAALSCFWVHQVVKTHHHHQPQRVCEEKQQFEKKKKNNTQAPKSELISVIKDQKITSTAHHP